MMKRNKLLVSAGALALAFGALLLPIQPATPATTSPPAPPPPPKPPALDLSSFSDANPEQPVDLLFIHHSVGGQLLTDSGPGKELIPDTNIYVNHPNGGGLRRKLEAASYKVHEAAYKSAVGDKTDLFDWLPKFRGQMDQVLRVAMHDEMLPEGMKNRVVMFKSCYPNNRFRTMGDAPGNPDGPDLTVWNAKASFQALLPEFAKQKDTLFVYLTAPANVLKNPKVRLWKHLAKRALGKPTDAEIAVDQAALAREFNGWIRSPEGWLKDYPEKNVVVFDFYDVLTDGGSSNFSQYGSEGGTDNHPSSQGNERAAVEFVPFLNRAARRAGIIP
ncbi:SGNH/GDSL hydrolase family protein [Chondromyces crocatus]|nr:SGNH/GDSL hydrolase family protein [Chondromyces crocatus]